MANKELTKSANQLLLENEELKSRLAETEKTVGTPYRIILEEMDEGAVLTNANGTILYCNKGFANLISEPVEKIVGSKCRSFVTDRERAGFGRLLKDGLKGKANGVISFLNKGHKLAVHLKLSIRPLSPGMICIIASDVTEIKEQQKKLENLIDIHKLEIIKAKETLNNDILEINKSKEALKESEYRLSSVYASMSDGLAIHDVIYDSSGAAIDYIITDVNPTFEKITGLKKDATLGKNASEVYSVKEAPYLDIYSEVASSGNPISFETFFQPMNKHFHVSVFSPGKGRFATVFQDITARKQTEEELQVILHRFYLILSKMQNGILLLTPESKIEFVNQPFCDMFGLKESPAELLNLSAEETILKIKGRYEDPDAAISRIQEIVKQGKPVIGEDVGMISGRTLLRDFIPIYLGKKQSGRLWNHIDITERKLISDTQNFLLQSSYSSSGENFFESLAKFLAGILAMDYVCIDKIEGDNLTARTVAIFNDGKIDPNISYTLKETPCGDVVGKTICCFPQNVCNLFPNDSALQELKAESYVGTTLWSHDGKPIGLIAVIGRNPLISTRLAEVVIKQVAVRAAGELERTQADYALRESEKKFRDLVKNAPTAIYEIDFLSKKFVTVNDAMCNLSGFTRDELLSMNVLDILDDESKMKFIARIGSCMRGEKPDETVEYSINNKDGHTVHALLNMKFNFDEHGKPVGAMVVGHDITERKKAQDKLLKTEQKLKYHLENSPLGVIEWDKNFQILQWSTEAERIFGLNKEETLGLRIDHLNLTYEEDIPIVEKTISRLISGKELKVISQNRNVTQAGDIIECIWYNSVLLDENGEMSSVMSLIEDITILRRTEKELLKSRESYKELVTNARSLIVKLDTQGRFTFVNEFALSFFGFQPKEMLGRSVMDTIIPKKESTGRDLVEMAEEIIEDPDRFSVNVNENIKKNGETVWVEWHNKALYDKSGNRTGHIAIGVDITKRKNAEEALKESENKLWTILNATEESIYMFDREGIIAMSNSTGLERLKASSGNEIIGHHFSEFMTPVTAKSRQAKLDEVFRSGRHLEFEDERDGRTYHHNFSPVFKDDKVSFIVTYSTDITERKRADIKLKESEDRFRTIAESLPVLISINRINDSKILFANEHHEKSFGFKKGELTGKKIFDIFYSPLDRINLSHTLKESGRTYSTEMKVNKPDGTPFWIMTSVRKIMFMNEPSFLTASIDITETKKSQEELLKLNHTLNAHSKSSQAMMHSDNELNYLNEVCKIIIEDCGYTMVWIGYAQNDKQKRVKPVAFYGFDKGYIDQMNITWDDNERGRGPTGMAIRTGNPSICKNMLTDPVFEPWREEARKRGYASSLVLPLITKGKPFGAISIYSKEPDSFADSEINLLSDLADDLAYGISYIRLKEAERAATMVIKKSEAQLKELNATKDKFFNIIAHDLKNPFTSLLGSSELLYNNINKMAPENIKKLSLILNDSAKGGYAILLNLLDWSRSQTGILKYKPEKINLKNLIDENISNLQLSAANKEIRLFSEIKDNLFVNADKNMINTLLRNLLNNAVKFTHRNGKVVIGAVTDSKNVIISVKDTGLGISEDKIEKLFRIDTKHSMPGTENEQGTGLGLKLCQEFVDKMGGKIWVESVENKGSTFKFSIPVKEGRLH